MTYADLPAGATVFLDASVFIHHFEPNARFGPAATEFLERIENQEINGLTATHIVSEVAHRLMTIEAMQAFGWTSAGIALRLRNHPHSRGPLGQGLAGPGRVRARWLHRSGADLSGERPATPPAAPQEAALRGGPPSRGSQGRPEACLNRPAATTFTSP
jgi:hypothetical protein